MKNDVPDIYVKIALVIMSVIFWAIIVWGYSQCIGYQKTQETDSESQIERETTSLILVGGNSIKAAVSPNTIHPQVLGMLGYGLSVEEAELLNKIIECESGWRNVCNAQYGCKSGQGIAQLIPTTVNHCEKMLGKKIDPFNEQDSLECAAWLLMNEGAGHWGTKETVGKWGSWDCFKDYTCKY